MPDELDDYLESRARIEAVWRQQERDRIMLKVAKVVLAVSKFVLIVFGLALLGYAFTALWMAL